MPLLVNSVFEQLSVTTNVLLTIIMRELVTYFCSVVETLIL